MPGTIFGLAYLGGGVYPMMGLLDIHVRLKWSFRWRYRPSVFHDCEQLGEADIQELERRIRILGREQSFMVLVSALQIVIRPRL